MSGGSMNYLYSHIQDAEFELTTPQRIAFKQHLNLVAEACKAIEWVDSGDNSEGSENEFITKCINNLNNVVITKDTLTLLLRRQICDLEAQSARIVADNVWDLDCVPKLKKPYFWEFWKFSAYNKECNIILYQLETHITSLQNIKHEV